MDPSTDFNLDYSQDSGSLEDSLGSLLATEFLFRLKEESMAVQRIKSDSGTFSIDEVLVDALVRITSSEFYVRFIRCFSNEPGNAINTIEKDKIEPQYDDLSFLAFRIDDSLIEKLESVEEDRHEVIEEVEELVEIIDDVEYEQYKYKIPKSLDEVEEVEELEEIGE